MPRKRRAWPRAPGTRRRAAFCGAFASHLKISLLRRRLPGGGLLFRLIVRGWLIVGRFERNGGSGRVFLILPPFDVVSAPKMAVAHGHLGFQGQEETLVADLLRVVVDRLVHILHGEIGGNIRYDGDSQRDVISPLHIDLPMEPRRDLLLLECNGFVRILLFHAVTEHVRQFAANVAPSLSAEIGMGGGVENLAENTRPFSAGNGSPDRFPG